MILNLNKNLTVESVGYETIYKIFLYLLISIGASQFFQTNPALFSFYVLVQFPVLLFLALQYYSYFLISSLVIIPFIPSVYGLDLGAAFPYISYSRILIYIIIISGIFLKKFTSANIKNYPLSRIILLIVLFFILNIVFSDFPFISIQTAFVIITEWFIFGFLVFSTLNKKFYIDVFINLFAIVFLISIFIGLIEFIIGYSPIYAAFFNSLSSANQRILAFDYSSAEAISSRMGLHRIQSLFPHPYFFSNMGVMAGIIFLCYYALKQQRIYIYLFILSLTSIFFGLSRASYIFFITCIFWLVFASKNFKVNKIIVIITLSFSLLFLVLYFYLPQIQNYLSVFDPKNIQDERYGSTLDSRLIMFSNALNLSSSRIIFGYGLGVPLWYLKIGKWNNIGFLEPDLLQWLLSVGITGLFLLILLFYRIYKLASISAKTNPLTLSFVPILFGILITFSFSSQLNYSFIFALSSLSISKIYN